MNRRLYRETHTLLDELAAATLDGTRKERRESYHQLRGEKWRRRRRRDGRAYGNSRSRYVDKLEPKHKPSDPDLVKRLEESMEQYGWIGRPLMVAKIKRRQIQVQGDWMNRSKSCLSQPRQCD